jgi:hypothetical protein
MGCRESVMDKQLIIEGLGCVHVQGLFVKGQWFIDITTPQATTAKQEQRIRALLDVPVSYVRFHWKGKKTCPR